MPDRRRHRQLTIMLVALAALLAVLIAGVVQPWNGVPSRQTARPTITTPARPSHATLPRPLPVITHQKVQARRFTLGATALSSSVLFKDFFSYGYASIGSSVTSKDNNWTAQGSPELWGRTNPGEDIALGGNDANAPISATVTQNTYGLPSAYFAVNAAGTTGLYQNSSVSWASNPVAVSFRADMEHGTGYTSTVLLTPDTLASSPTAQSNYIGLFALADGKLHIRQSVGGTMTELAAVSYLFRSDEFRDWRVTVSAGGGFTVEQYSGMASLLTDTGAVTNTMGTMPSLWKTLYTGSGLTYGFTTGHLYASITSDGSHNGERGLTNPNDGYYTGFDQVSEVNTSALPTPAIPTISGINAQDNSAFVTFNPDTTDANIVGYSLAWWTPTTWAQGAGNGSAPPSNRKNSTWVGQGVIQATGLVASQAYTYTVQAITTGGFYGPASAPMSATGQPFGDGSASTEAGVALNGYLDTFDGSDCVQGFMNQAEYDTRWSFITHDSPLFCMSKHWMSNLLLGDDSSQGLGPNAGLDVRTRVPFDFSSSSAGAFGVIYDEVDNWDPTRTWWSIHVDPALYDSRQLARDFQTLAQYTPPPQFLELTHHNARFDLNVGTSSNQLRTFYSPAYQGVPDVRDHLIVKLSSNEMDLYINTPVTGTPFWTVTGLNLDYNHGYIYQGHDNYHTDIGPPQVGVNDNDTPDRNEHHWGIFGFTAPVGTTTPTFRVFTPASCQLGFLPRWTCDEQNAVNPSTDSYTLPADAASSAGALYTFLGGYGTFAQTAPTNATTQVQLVVNGHAPLPVFLPYSPSSTDQNGFTANVPPSYLVNGGTNTFVIQTTNGNFRTYDPQLELSSAAVPSFEQAQTVYGAAAPATPVPVNSPTPTATPTTAPNAPNLLGNPGFETGSAAPWTGYGNNQVSDASHHPVHTGNWAGETELTGSGLYQTVTGLQSNTTYNVSGWVNSQGSGDQGGRMFVDTYDSANANASVSSPSVLNTGAGFTQVGLSFTTGASSTSARILFNSVGTNPSNGTGYPVEFDDAYMGLAPATPPPTATPTQAPIPANTNTPTNTPVPALSVQITNIQASPATVAQSGTETFTATLTSNQTVASVNVGFPLIAPGAVSVSPPGISGINLTANIPQTVSETYALTSGASLGTWEVGAQVYDSTFANRIGYVGPTTATTFTVVAGTAPTATPLPTATPVPGNQTAAITVSVGTILASISKSSLGIDTSVNDSALTGATTAPYLNGANIGSLRYPGGETADAYHWATNSIDPSRSDYADPSAGIDNFYTNVVSPTHSQTNTFITINYATGTASEAAAWVQHNKTNGYGIVNYEIGNEQYFNKSNFANPVNRYITQVISDVNAMRAVDPSIKVWVPFDVDHNFAMVSNGVSQWNGPVVSALCSYIDGVDVHSYPQGPGSENDTSLLANVPGYVSGGASYIKQTLTQSCPNKPLLFKIGEANSVSYNPGKQTSNLPNALFMADHELTWLENGATTYQPWDLRGGPQSGGNTASTLYGGYLPGDYGVLGHNGSNPDGDNAPFPDAHALEMVGTAVGSGGSLVGTSSSTSMLGVHAVKRADGSLALLIENRDPTNSYAVNVNLPGYTPATSGTTYNYGEGSHLGVQPGGVNTAAVAGLGGTFNQTVAPYSLTTMVMTPAGGVSPANTPTNTPVNTPTNTPVNTPTPTSTPIVVATTTPISPPSTPTATVIPTATGTSAPTNTAIPVATNTSVPAATNTSVPAATNTPLPTNTPTNTATPGPTQTPAPLPAIVGQTTAAVVAPGAVILNTTITSTANLQSPIVEFDVASLATGARVYTVSFTTYLLRAGTATHVGGLIWRVPAGQSASAYRVSVVVYAARYLAILGRDPSGAVVAVGGPSPTATPTATTAPPTATLTPGGPTSTPTPASPPLVSASARVTGQLRPNGYALIALSLTDAVAARGPLVRVMIRDITGHLVYQAPAFTVYTLTPNVPQTAGVVVWRIPPGQAPGAYSVTVAVYAAGYLQVLLPETTAATLTVSAAAPLGGNQRGQRRAPAYPRPTPATAAAPSPYPVA